MTKGFIAFLVAPIARPAATYLGVTTVRVALKVAAVKVAQLSVAYLAVYVSGKIFSDAVKELGGDIATHVAQHLRARNVY